MTTTDHSECFDESVETIGVLNPGTPPIQTIVSRECRHVHVSKEPRPSVTFGEPMEWVMHCHCCGEVWPA